MKKIWEEIKYTLGIPLSAGGIGVYGMLAMLIIIWLITK
jgi:hypothetical protein